LIVGHDGTVGGRTDRAAAFRDRHQSSLRRSFTSSSLRSSASSVAPIVPILPRRRRGTCLMCLHKLWACDQQLHLTDADKARGEGAVRSVRRLRERAAAVRCGRVRGSGHHGCPHQVPAGAPPLHAVSGVITLRSAGRVPGQLGELVPRALLRLASRQGDGPDFGRSVSRSEARGKLSAWGASTQRPKPGGVDPHEAEGQRGTV
jgi:hypothetical protein